MASLIYCKFLSKITFFSLNFFNLNQMSRNLWRNVFKNMNEYQLERCKQIMEKMLKKPIATHLCNLKECQDSDLKSPPIDFITIQDRLKNNVYDSTKKWEEDVNSIFENVKNQKISPYDQIALELQQYFNQAIQDIPTTRYESWALRARKINDKIKETLLFLQESASLTPEKVPQIERNCSMVLDFE